jgi:hypothetical protein
MSEQESQSQEVDAVFDHTIAMIIKGAKTLIAAGAATPTEATNLSFQIWMTALHESHSTVRGLGGLGLAGLGAFTERPQKLKKR